MSKYTCVVCGAVFEANLPDKKDANFDLLHRDNPHCLRCAINEDMAQSYKAFMRHIDQIIENLE